MPAYEDRNAEVWNLPFPSVNLLLIPQKIILRFAIGKSIDFGEFCYLERYAGRREKGKGRLVDKTTFCAMRAEKVSELIRKANIAFTSSGRRPNGLFSKYDRWWQFTNWCYLNGHSDVLLSVPSARSALVARVQELRRMVDQHLTHNNTAFVEQYYAINVLEDLFEIENLGRGINLIRGSKDLVLNTRVPSEDTQEVVLRCCISLFDGLGDFVLGNGGKINPYPYAIEVPDIFERKGNQLWIFPQRQWFGHASSKWNSAYDYENGRLFTIDELTKLLPNARLSDLKKRLRHAALHIIAANSDPQHWSRLERALLCAKAFFVIFLAATGANEAPAAEIPWSGELEQEALNPLNSTQGFRSIKYRAGGRTVQFEIGIRYLPYFRRYLELRKFLLQGKSCETLFFDLEVGRVEGPKITSARRMTLGFYRRLEHLVPSLPRVHSKQWRAAKQDYVVRRKDPVTAALVMQHSLPTAIKAYSNGSQSDHENEMGTFLTSVESAILLRSESDTSRERSIGSCVNQDTPMPTSQAPLIQPNCKVSEGCLFCSNYRIHADSIDTRKLLSARQCIRVSARYSTGYGESENFFARLLERIEGLIGLIRERDPNLVSKIELEVDVSGDLDPFWAAKIETLIELGMEL